MNITVNGMNAKNLGGCILSCDKAGNPDVTTA